MDALLNILPEAILYFASGFLFICGFYFLIDRRFDFFSDVGLSILLVIGFAITNTSRAIPKPFHLPNEFTRNICILLISFLSGLVVAFIRNKLAPHISKFTIKIGRRKTSSINFWYDIIEDDPEKAVWIRLTSFEKNYIIEGILISLSEDRENPYLLLNNYIEYNLDGDIIDDTNFKKDNVQIIVRPDNFDKVMLTYDENSSKCVHINIIDEDLDDV